MPSDESTFYERFMEIRGWIERRSDEPGTVQTRQLVAGVQGTGAVGPAALPSARPAGRVGPRRRVRCPRQLALELGGTAA